MHRHHMRFQDSCTALLFLLPILLTAASLEASHAIQAKAPHAQAEWDEEEEAQQHASWQRCIPDVGPTQQFSLLNLHCIL